MITSFSRIIWCVSFFCSLATVNNAFSPTMPPTRKIVLDILSSKLLLPKPRQQRQWIVSSVSLFVQTVRDADMMEMMVGGQRYEMVPLPDSMLDTTLFVGNLNEFVNDDDLSQFFRVVSTYSVPACVVRRPNMSSLGYGFVTFPTMEEKEAAIIRLDGSTFRGRTIKVEEIRDHPKKGRVKVPEKLVSYVVGAAKKTREGKSNTMRSIKRLEDKEAAEKKRKQKMAYNNQNNHNKKGKVLTSTTSTTIMGSGACNNIIRFYKKLTDSQQQELLRASRRGYVTLEGTGYRRGRKTSTLACAHRQWCDEQKKPQIVLCKASGGRPLDCVIVDLSPLRIMGMGDDTELVNDFLLSWKTQIVMAAANAGMELRSDYREDNCETLSNFEDDEDEEDCNDNDGDFFEECAPQESYTLLLTAEDSWATEPISKLPVLSMGVFEGERSKAKAMARELALLWDIPEEDLDMVENEKCRKRNKRNDHPRRRRDQGRKSINFFI